MRADRKSKSALEARMILCELTLRTSGNVLAAQRQFRPMTEAQKGLSVDRWLNQSNVFTEEKNPNVRQAYAAFLSSVGDWADRAKHPNAEKIRFLAASLIPKQNGNRNAAPVYEKVARSSRDAETREKALFDMAIAHLNSDRFSEALAALHRVNSPKSMERRFDTVIQVCQKNPDSLAALRHLRQEQSFCPVGPLRSRFDISIAQIHLREEHYEAAEAHLLAADAQYSYAAVMDDLKKRYESEKKAGEQLRKRIAERIKDLNQGKIKP